MKYKIEISLAEDSRIVKHLHCPYYHSNGKTDTVTFSPKCIVIEADRGKSYTEDDIFTNVQNSLYNQMLKTLFYHYSVNGKNSAISHIKVTSEAQGQETEIAEKVFSESNQPLPVVESPISLDVNTLEMLMDETDASYDLRVVIAHWLKAMGETNVRGKMECIWLAFERLCIYRRHRNRNETPYVSISLMEMAKALKVHGNMYPRALSLVSHMTYTDLRRLMWHDLIEETYKIHSNPYKPKELDDFEKKYLNGFAKQFDDTRVVQLIYDTRKYVKDELNAIQEYANLKSLLEGKINAGVSCDADLLALLSCYYAYFLRIRLFHGHALMKCSIFDKQSDKMGVGMIEEILETLVGEVINNFRNL